MSISQISEIYFAIPFSWDLGLNRYAYFNAWVLRFGLFAYGNPGDGLWMIIMSCVVYGMAFDFLIFQFIIC
jgi:NHS family xanthosine MFS transporter